MQDMRDLAGRGNRSLGRYLCGLFLLMTLVGCATTPQTQRLLETRPARIPEQVRLGEVPFHPQEQYQCGPAALAMMLGAQSLALSPEELVPLVYLPGREGSLQVELVAAARSFGQVPYRLDPELTALLGELAAGHPVLVLQNLGLGMLPQWHFAVATGYDLNRRELVLHSGTRRDYRVPLKTFERTWQRGAHWAVVILPPGELPATASALGYFSALGDLEQTHDDDAALLTAYRGALGRWPESRELLMGFGNVAYRTGDMDAARESFGSAAQLYPDYAPAFNNLAYVLKRQGHPRQALEQAAHALRLAGDDETMAARYRDTYDEIDAALRASAVQ